MTRHANNKVIIGYRALRKPCTLVQLHPELPSRMAPAPKRGIASVPRKQIPVRNNVEPETRREQSGKARLISFNVMNGTYLVFPIAGERKKNMSIIYYIDVIETHGVNQNIFTSKEIPVAHIR